jgi:two-component system NarL family response regulator
MRAKRKSLPLSSDDGSRAAGKFAAKAAAVRLQEIVTSADRLDQLKTAILEPPETDSHSRLTARLLKGSVLTILVADDHPLVREGLVAVINRRPDMRVVAEASNGRDAVDKFFSHQPDIALLDLRMPLMDGIEAALAISERQPGAKIVIVSSYQSEEEVYRAMRAGAQGYILKDAPLDDLIECIHALAQGRAWIPPGVGAKLARRVTGQELTARETEVLRAMSAGKSNKEIGAMLKITESTVKVHVTHLLEKLKASGRTEAISVALKRGLVTVDSTQIS